MKCIAIILFLDGRQLGVLGQELRSVWVESDFKMEADELLKFIPEIVDKIKENDPRKSKGKK